MDVVGHETDVQQATPNRRQDLAGILIEIEAATVIA